MPKYLWASKRARPNSFDLGYALSLSVYGPCKMLDQTPLGSTTCFVPKLLGLAIGCTQTESDVKLKHNILPKMFQHIYSSPATYDNLVKIDAGFNYMIHCFWFV